MTSATAPILEVAPSLPTDGVLRQAIHVLGSGGVVAFPTDTLYGIGCELGRPHAIDRIQKMREFDGSKRPLTFLLPDIGELTQQASRIAGDVANVTKRLEGVLDSNAVKELKASIQDLSQISRRLAGFARSQTQRLDTVGENISLGSSAFVRTVTRLDSATSGGIVPEVAGNTRMALADLRKAAADLREVTEAAAQNKVSMVQALQSADSILRRIERGQGTLGMLASDTMLYREATLTFQEARALIADIRNNPKKYLKVSVF